MKKSYMIECLEIDLHELYDTLSRKEEIIQNKGEDEWRFIYRTLCNIVRNMLDINNLLSLSIKKPEHRKENEYKVLVIIFDTTVNDVETTNYYILKKETVDDINSTYYIEL